MTAAGSHTQTIPRSVHDGPVPLSFPQERLFLLDRLMPGLPAYNVPTLVKIGVGLEADVLRRAFELIVSRHEVLRTKIELLDGSPVQEVLPPAPFELTVVDVRSLPSSER